MSDKDNGKFIALILRHKPEVIGINLDSHGWADTNKLIEGIARTRRFDMVALERIVRNDDKGRYEFNEDKSKIRARQGHSVNVDAELEEKTPPAVLYHGTGEKSVSSIQKEGLKRGNRLYVHLSADMETAIKVGSRHGKPVVFTVDTGRMLDDGYRFLLSRNGVWLTKAVPVKYLTLQK